MEYSSCSCITKATATYSALTAPVWVVGITELSGGASLSCPDANANETQVKRGTQGFATRHGYRNIPISPHMPKRQPQSADCTKLYVLFLAISSLVVWGTTCENTCDNLTSRNVANARTRPFVL